MELLKQLGWWKEGQDWDRPLRSVADFRVYHDWLIDEGGYSFDQAEVYKKYVDLIAKEHRDLDDMRPVGKAIFWIEARTSQRGDRPGKLAGDRIDGVILRDHNSGGKLRGSSRLIVIQVSDRLLQTGTENPVEWIRLWSGNEDISFGVWNRTLAAPYLGDSRCDAALAASVAMRIPNAVFRFAHSAGRLSYGWFGKRDAAERRTEFILAHESRKGRAKCGDFKCPDATNSPPQIAPVDEEKICKHCRHRKAVPKDKYQRCSACQDMVPGRR